MQIELIVGAIGGIAITWIFIKREKNRKKSRGDLLTNTIVRDTIIPLRKKIRLFYNIIIDQIEIKKPEYELEKYDKLQSIWEQIRDWKSRIYPLLTVSGDILNTEQHILLGKILDILETDFRLHKDILHFKVHVLNLERLLTEYLKMNKDSVMKIYVEAKKSYKKRLLEISEIKDEEDAVWASTSSQNSMRAFERDIADIIKDKN
ncbi:hypothetical protein [Candidatus Nitrosotenuis aquarius]|uniref:hypothetical protein n=1 Tax=Candidatus Nitrosotenuis aquarius TaxID=1846278 RepID=UPI000C1EB532|nr:hypothetical protein [Candidatus Nitrosotenuis aquarius]